MSKWIRWDEIKFEKWLMKGNNECMRLNKRNKMVWVKEWSYVRLRLWGKCANKILAI